MPRLTKVLKVPWIFLCQDPSNDHQHLAPPSVCLGILVITMHTEFSSVTFVSHCRSHILTWIPTDKDYMVCQVEGINTSILWSLSKGFLRPEAKVAQLFLSSLMKYRDCRASKC
ncbi:Uncharacterized protein HZ326_5789 [Fusarium oxysporum f. sp. albedinis]|nr:Uncharacterized protein HZ326_5789 [Fusarium oxysporum f. sp. albedinis]